MNAITVGKPYIFVKGVAEQVFTEPETGNIIGYDNIATDGGISVSVNMQELAGGLGNVIVGIIPDSARIAGTYTSQAFSLETRRLISGGKLAYNGIAPVCETITATSSTLTVSKTPARALEQKASDTYGWCYVRIHGAESFDGTNQKIDLSTKAVISLAATSGITYDVIYFTAIASAQQLDVPEVFNPTLVAVRQKYAVYATQNVSNISGGTLQGYMYVVVPLAECSGDMGLSGTQTSNSTTNGNWTAIAPKLAMDCGCGKIGGNMAYYVYVPCDQFADVEGIGVINGGISRDTLAPVQVPVKLVMADGSLIQPPQENMTYQVTTGTGTVDANGIFTPSASGNYVVKCTFAPGGGRPSLVCNCSITVALS